MSVECSDDEQSTAVNALKLLPSAGRGLKLPPICNISLPEAYYDELPSHVQMLSKSGLGRGQLLQELGSENRALGCTGERCKSANGEDIIVEEDTASHPAAEASQISLKSLAAQFSTVKQDV